MQCGLKRSLLLMMLMIGSPFLCADDLKVGDLMKAQMHHQFYLSSTGRHLAQEYSPSMSERSNLRDPSGLFKMIRLFRIDEEGQPHIVRLNRLSSPEGGFLGMTPVFSPDGERLAFARPADEGDGGWVMSILDLAELKLIDLPLRVHRFHWSAYTNADWASDRLFVYDAEPESGLGVAYSLSPGVSATQHARNRWSAESGMTEPAVTTFSASPKDGGKDCSPGRLAVYDVKKREHRVLHNAEVRGLKALGDGRRLVGLEPCKLEKTRPLVTNRDAQIHLGLLLLDAVSGSVSRPCGDCNLKYNSINVAPDGKAIAFLAYDDSGVALDAQLYEYNVSRSKLRRFDTRGLLIDSIDPRVDFALPGYVVWLGNALAVHAARRPTGVSESLMRVLLEDNNPRRDWFMVRPDREPNALTESFDTFSKNPLAADGESFVIAVGEELHRLTPRGSAGRIAALEESGNLSQIGRKYPPSSFLNWQLNARAGLHRIGQDGSTIYWWDGRLHDLGRVRGEVLTMSESGAVFITQESLRGGSRYVIYARAAHDAGLSSRELWAENEHLQGLWPDGRPLEYAGPDNERYTACLYLPSNRNRTEALPLIVDVYPNLESKVRGCKRQFEGDFVPLFAARGYAVLSMYMPVGIRNSADRSFNDTSKWVLAATDAAAQAANIDTNRMGVHGASQGGFVVTELLTQTDRFKAAVAGICDVDYLSIGYGQNLISVLDTDVHLGGDSHSRFVDRGQFIWMGSYPWEEPQAWVNVLPIFRADRIRTPLLLWTNEFDSFSTRSFFQLYNVLKQLGRTVELDYYYNEGHGHARPANFEHHYTRVFEWFDSRLKSAPQEMHGAS